MAMNPSRRSPVVAVIDIGSNSGRVAVYALDRAGHLRLITASRAPLRLVHDVDLTGSLSEDAMARTMTAVRDFHALAIGAGARRTAAIATAALRDAGNGARLIDRIRREIGIAVRLIDGDVEAGYGFAGAVRGLPVTHGLLFDMGGGSMQVSRFTKRTLARARSLPLGALRLTERFLVSDPVKARDLARLHRHVRRQLERAGIGRLERGGRLVGTGGTLRNLAKIDHHAREYPIGRLHGYQLSLARLRRLTSTLASRRRKTRDEIAGLSADRADSIVGGAVAISTLMELVGAKNVLVSGQGVREGVALSLLGVKVSALDDVRESALASLTMRFDTWRADRAARRSALAGELVRSLNPRGGEALADAVECGARVLDIGQSVDTIGRCEHTADILLATELNGFGHDEVALAAALVRKAGDRHADTEALEPLLDGRATENLDRGAVLLALADAIEARCPPGRAIRVTCRTDRRVRVSVPQLASWRPGDLERRFSRAFGKPLVVSARQRG